MFLLRNKKVNFCYALLTKVLLIRLQGCASWSATLLFEKVGLYWIWVVRHSVRHNFVSTQYHENILIEFYQILYALILTRPRFELLCIIFSYICNRAMALDLCRNFVHNFVSAQIS